MLNSIGFPMAGLAPPRGSGAHVEQPDRAGGFAALLRTASAPHRDRAPQAPANEVRADTGLDQAPAVEDHDDPGTATAPTDSVHSHGDAVMSQAARPDRSSEAEGVEVADLEVESVSAGLEVSPLAAMLSQLAPPPIPLPAAPAAPEAAAPPVTDAVEVIATAGASATAATSVAEVASEAAPEAGTPVEAPSVPRGQVTAAEAQQTERPMAGQAADAPRASERPEHPERPETSRAPEDRFSELVRAADPQDRSAIASTLNREGGRFDGQPSRPEQAAEPATPAQPADDTPAVPSTGASNATSSLATPVDELAGAGAGLGEDASRDALDDVQARPAADGSGQAADRAVRTDSSAAQAASGAANQRPAEVATFRTEQTAPPVEARDAAALNAGLVDTVHAAVRRALPNGSEMIRLVLNPPDLGHLDIRVTSGADGVRVAVTAATAEATDLIKQHLPGLVAGLEARDLRVDRTDVRQAAGAELGTDLGSRDPRSNSRQPGDRGANGEPQWARPEWSGVAALDRASDRATARRSEQASTRLLDLVA